MEHARELAPFAKTGAEGIFRYDSAVQPGRSGGGTPLVLIHGLGDEADTWRLVFPALAAGRRVVALDLPGFGRTPCSGPSTMKKHVGSVCRILEETGPAVLAGNSMGAAVAQLAALARPDLAKALVLIDGGLPSSAPVSVKMLLGLLPGIGERAYRSWRRNPSDAYSSLIPYYADLPSMSEADKSFLARRVADRVMSDSQCRAYCSSFRSFIYAAASSGGRFSSNFAKSRCPLLVLWGEADRILPPSTRQPVLDARPDARSISIPRAGHLPHQENPAAVIEALDSFMNALDTGD